jgi:hypothetical protein
MRSSTKALVQHFQGGQGALTAIATSRCDIFFVKSWTWAVGVPSGCIADTSSFYNQDLNPHITKSVSCQEP